jgi:hypothetical protein
VVPHFEEGWIPTLFKDVYRLDKFQTYVNTVADHALVFVAGRFIAAGRVAATSFQLVPGLSKQTLLVLPFSIAVRQPGLLHVALDTAFYKAHDVFHVLDDAYRRYVEWLRTVSREELISAVGKDAYDILTEGGTRSRLLAEFIVPPNWIADP